MARTEREVIEALKKIYADQFGGKENQRFLISWSDLRSIYGYGALFTSRFALLAEEAVRRRLYLFDLGESENGHFVAVVRRRTVDRWRRLPKKVAEEYRDPSNEDEEEVVDEDAE